MTWAAECQTVSIDLQAVMIDMMYVTQWAWPLAAWRIIEIQEHVNTTETHRATYRPTDRRTYGDGKRGGVSVEGAGCVGGGMKVTERLICRCH